MRSAEMPLVPPALRESVFLILEGCTWRSVLQDHGGGSGSTAKTAKKVVWRWEVTRRSACQLRAKRETLLGCKSLKALTLLKRARLKSWSIRLGLTILSNEWHGRQVTRWSPGHAERTLRQLERDLFPWIGDREMSQIQPMELLAVLQKVEERGAIETADRALMLARQVWRYWLPTASNTQRDITEGLKARLTPYRGSNFPAIVEPERFGELLRAMYAYKGGPFVRTALLLAPLLYQRPANLRMMEWEELDLDGQLWTIPSAKMKRSVQEKENGEPHVVPLPKQAVAMLRELKPLSGRGRYVFPGQRDHDRPMSDNSVRTALYSLGFGDEQSWHGFRASARTMLVDQLDLDPLAIEANLAHAVKDANGRSYNRTKYLAKRFDQVQQWADYLDRLRNGGANVVALHQRLG